MAVSISYALHKPAYDAAMAVPDGQRNVTFLQNIATALGSNPVRELRRNGTLVWEGVWPGATPIVNDRLVFPTAFQQSSISTADIDTGTWVHRLRRSDNASLYIECSVTPTAGGGDMKLSLDLTSGSTLYANQWQVFAPALDSVGSGSYPTLNDPRMLWYIDPRTTFAGQAFASSTLRQTTGTNAYISTITEPGIIGSGSDYRLERVADPDNGAKRAFKHKIASTWSTYDGNTWRSEITHDWLNNGVQVMRDVEYWAGFAVRLDSSLVTNGPGVSVMDFHGVPVPWRVGAASPISIRYWGGNFVFTAHYRYDPVDSQAGRPALANDAGTSLAGSAATWYFFALNFKIASNVDDGFWYMWRKPAGSSTTQVVNYTGPIGYGLNNEAWYPQKFGLYTWDYPWVATSTSSMVHTKGLFIYRAGSGTPTIDQTSIIALMESI